MMAHILEKVSKDKFEIVQRSNRNLELHLERKKDFDRLSTCPDDFDMDTGNSEPTFFNTIWHKNFHINKNEAYSINIGTMTRWHFSISFNLRKYDHRGYELSILLGRVYIEAGRCDRRHWDFETMDFEKSRKDLL